MGAAGMDPVVARAVVEVGGEVEGGDVVVASLLLRITADLRLTSAHRTRAQNDGR
jgi:hypothetical protein